MTTKGALITQIATDLIRSDLTSVIGQAIDDAIDRYKSTRFYFNETRDSVLTLVDTQYRYSDSDTWASNQPKISQFLEIDAVFVIESSQNYGPLGKKDPSVIERFASDSSAQTGRPYDYARFADGVWFYPVPDDTSRTVRFVGHYELAGPASDGEASNKWMTEAYQLIRYAAQTNIYGLPRYKDFEKQKSAQYWESYYLNELLGRGGRKSGMGRIRRGMPL
jgi:hypothetical protein